MVTIEIPASHTDGQAGGSTFNGGMVMAWKASGAGSCVQKVIG